MAKLVGKMKIIFVVFNEVYYVLHSIRTYNNNIEHKMYFETIHK